MERWECRNKCWIYWRLEQSSSHECLWKPCLGYSRFDSNFFWLQMPKSERFGIILYPRSSHGNDFLVGSKPNSNSVLGPITATYTAGQVASFEVTITAAHMGFYEFRLCPRALSTKSELVQCFLSRPPLKRQTPLAPGEKSRYVEGGPAQWSQEDLETRWRAPSLNAANAGDLFAQVRDSFCGVNTA